MQQEKILRVRGDKIWVKISKPKTNNEADFGCRVRRGSLQLYGPLV